MGILRVNNGVQIGSGVNFQAEGAGGDPALIVRSVIFDIADNYGDASYVGIRQVDFYSNGQLIDVLSGDITCNSTSSISTRGPTNAFDTSTSKTGGGSDNSWLSGNGNNTNQRLIVRFNAQVVIDKIVINNSHATNSTGGIETDRGAKNVVIQSSTDDYSDTTYGAVVTNATQLFDGTFSQHVAADVEDDETVVTLLASSSKTAKSVTFDIADNWLDDQYVGIRSVDFYYKDTKLLFEGADIEANATTKFGTNRNPEFIFQTALSKTGGAKNTSWMSSAGNITNQRVNLNWDIRQTFDKIIINNEHGTDNVGGNATDRGTQNVKVTISTDTITDVTYDAAIANSEVIFDGFWDQHVALDQEDPQTIYDIG